MNHFPKSKFLNPNLARVQGSSPDFRPAGRLWPFGFWTLICALGVTAPAFALRADQSPAPAAAVSQTNAVPDRLFTEKEALELLTTTLQRDYVKDRGELELIFTQPWKAPTLPAEPLTVKVLEIPTAGVTSFFILRFQLCTADQTLGTWQASLQAHVWRETWVAHSTLQRGMPVTSADIAYEKFDMLKVREPLAEFSQNDSTLEIAEPVAAGYPILARLVRPRVVMHRGQIASAVLQDGALSVSTKVEVLDDGAPGQTVRARNPVSHRNLSGTVVDSRTLSISL